MTNFGAQRQQLKNHDTESPFTVFGVCMYGHATSLCMFLNKSVDLASNGLQPEAIAIITEFLFMLLAVIFWLWLFRAFSTF